MSTPQDEAISIFKSVIDLQLSKTIDIKSALRQCFHACQVLGWNEQQSWFNNELNGYPVGVELPPYRKITGHTIWDSTGGLDAILDKVIDDQYRIGKEPTKPVILNVTAGIDWIISAAQHGYRESTGNKSTKYISHARRNIETEEYNVYNISCFQVIIQTIDNQVFNFASQSYSLLRYGDALQDIWQAYRTKVDKSLTDIGFNEHLDAIRAGLNSTNPEEWRQAIWSCRDLLHDLAGYLWKDPRSTYDKLPGKDGKLKVTDENYVNRLSAYLHCKGVTGSHGAYIRSEMERISHSIGTLNELANTAHGGEITMPIVRTTAIGTYIILGELVNHTDMQPVTNY